MAMIGIDLGTTNSLISYWSESGPIMIPNIHGSNLTPSVVSINENNEILVGQIAQERQITHPHLTASTFKRYMGSQRVYKLGPYNFTPEELSALVLKSLKADAEIFLACDVDEAVISVPAYFNDMQRTATKRAAELAGLKVERLISEPTAAALSYGLHQTSTESKFVVFDLGGGTFDVSVLEHFEGVLEVKSIAGDNYLGGEDFTEILMTHFAQTFELTALNEKEKALLYKQAELCKKALSENQSAEMTFVKHGECVRKTYERADYERLLMPLLIRLKQPVEKALRDADVSIRELDAILMIGGASRMHPVRSTVGKLFGKLPYAHINPDEAVALGAAIQAALKARDKALDELILTDVCPYTLGIAVVKTRSTGQVESGYFSPIIERNSTIPISRMQTYQTVKKNQKTIELEIYQGESRRVDDNFKIGTLKVKVPSNSAGSEHVDVRFTYDINGILEVEAHVISTSIITRTFIDNGQTGLSQSEITARFLKLKDLKVHPRENKENLLLIARGERLYEELLGTRREYVAFLLQQFESVMNTQDTRLIVEGALELRERLDELDDPYV